METQTISETVEQEEDKALQKLRNQSVDCDAFVSDALRKLNSETEKLLLVQNQYSPSPSKFLRAILLDISGNECKLVKDSWVDTPSFKKIAAGLANRRYTVCIGECDAMFATSFGYAWTESRISNNASIDDNIFELWSPKERLVVVTKTALWHNGVEHSISDIKQVFGWIDKTWCEREVRIIMEDGNHIVVAQESDSMPSIDFTYDGLNLLCETAWMHSMCNSLSKSINVSVDFSDDLK